MMRPGTNKTSLSPPPHAARPHRRLPRQRHRARSALRMTPTPATANRHALTVARDALCVMLLVYLLCIAGILTRPLGLLAAFWPANAVLLGLFVRRPRLVGPGGWLGATLGYLAADLLTGTPLWPALWLTATNLASVGVSYLLFRPLSYDDRRLRRPQAVMLVFWICAAGAAAAALVCTFLAPALAGLDFATSTLSWFTGELTNNLVVLPVLLTAPTLSLRAILPRQPLLRLQQIVRSASGPALTLAASVPATLLIGGPGALAFPVPALLWCALSFSPFTTAVLTALVNAWQMIAVTLDLLPNLAVEGSPQAIISMRLGVTLLALGPITAASISATRRETLRILDHQLNHDSLTGALTRGALLKQGAAALTQLKPHQPVAVLMLDIDHFKRINDHYGHATGDHTLAVFAATIAANLRANDLFGRLGGEEFAIIMPDTTPARAQEVAERLRAQTEQAHVQVAEGRAPLQLTVSIGVAHQMPGHTLPQALALADKLLYEAKAAGRNRVRSNAAPTADHNQMALAQM